MRYKICLEYDGTNYSGWQKQGQGLSIQEVIEDSLVKLSGEHAEIIGCGRTDAGVHAISQFAHFDLNKKISEISNLFLNPTGRHSILNLPAFKVITNLLLF